MMTGSPFSAEAWAANLARYEAIRDMPFNRALADGTLPLDRFQAYMVQDAHYLVTFGQALALAAAKSDEPDLIVQFSRGAETAIIVERDLHATYFRRFGLDEAAAQATPLSPACHHYRCFLLATAFREPLPVLAAALLPCFWIYAEVGRHIHAGATSGNAYQAWIDTYAGEDFEGAVRDMITATDHLALDASERERAAMMEVFTRATQLEWMFWTSAWEGGQWPL